MSSTSSSQGASNTHAVQVRIETQSGGRAAGQRKHDLRQGAQPDYVDVAMTPLNRVLITPFTGTALRKESERRRAMRPTQRAMKSSAAVGLAGIVTFGHAAQPLFERLAPDAQDAAYREVAEAVASRLGTTLTGLVVHRDESAPHAHFQLVGYCLDGNPVSAVAKRGSLRDLQTLAAEIMGRHAPGIERGHSKAGRLKGGATPAEVVHRSVAELHDDLPHEIATLRAQVADLQVRIAEAEERAATNDERARKALAKAEGDDAKAAKALRNAVAYERRAEDARAEVGRLTTQAEGLGRKVAAAEAALTKAQGAQAAAEGARQAAERQAQDARTDRDAAQQEARTAQDARTAAEGAAATAQRTTAAIEVREGAVQGREAAVAAREADVQGRLAGLGDAEARVEEAEELVRNANEVLLTIGTAVIEATNGSYKDAVNADDQEVHAALIEAGRHLVPDGPLTYGVLRRLEVSYDWITGEPLRHDESTEWAAMEALDRLDAFVTKRKADDAKLETAQAAVALQRADLAKRQQVVAAQEEAATLAAAQGRAQGLAEARDALAMARVLATGELAPEGLSKEALGLRAHVARVRQARAEDDRQRRFATGHGYGSSASETDAWHNAFFGYLERAGTPFDDARLALEELRGRQPDWGRLGAGQSLLERARLVVDALRRWWNDAARIVATLVRDAPVRDVELAATLDRVLRDLPEDGSSLQPLQRAVEQDGAVVVVAERLVSDGVTPSRSTPS